MRKSYVKTKEYIKKTMPGTFKLFRSLLMKKNDEREREKEIFKKKIIDSVFSSNLLVRNGPFKGILYTDTSYCSALFPKIIGSYEEPIQPWINEAINKKYKKIIDIGSAEGYYSVGLAVTSPYSQIYAYDINNKALDENKRLAKLNNVENKIIFKNECDNKELDQIIIPGSLIICDIEGSEKQLLDPKKTPRLELADIIIEAHDCYVSGMTEILIKRFHRTHKIEIIVDYQRDTGLLSQYSADPEISKVLLDEGRPSGMKWLRMTKI